MKFSKWKILASYDLLRSFWKNFITYREYPNDDNSFLVNKYNNNYTYEDIAIVIQGNWINDSTYTFNTIKIYKKIFPEVKVILSVWNLSEKYIEILQEMEVYIVLNPDIPNPGISNINRQITTSLAGVKLASDIGCKYCIKSRTDQRIYSAGALLYLKNLINFFSDDNEDKIIVGSRNTFKYRLYGISDMFQFGRTHDLLAFWSCPLDSRPAQVGQPKSIQTLLDYSKWCVCEVYLVTSYLRKLNVAISWTLRQYRNILTSYFIVIDVNSIGLHWFKYSFRESMWLNYEDEFRKQEIGFNDWLLYHEENYLSESEAIIHERV